MFNSEIYLRAAQYIEERGLAKGTFEKASGELCIAGACNLAASGGRDSYPPVCGDYWLQLQQWAGTAFLSEWNDRPERTPEEVIDLLVIASIELEETP